MDKISVLVPCCNVEKYIRECLDSIKTQTYTNLEIICIDDGSKDNTGAIIDEYVAADKRFKAIHKPNSGYGDSMNKGLDSCTGDYIGIVESDDWIEPVMFEVLHQTAKENDLDLVRCCWYEGPTGTESEKHEKIFLQQPSIWVGLYRRDLLEEGRKIRFLPTPGASYQDSSFAFKVYTKSKHFMMLDKPLHHYRINPNSSVSSSGKIYCILDEWEEMRRWVFEDPVLYKKFSKSSLFPRIWYGGLVWNYDRLSKTVLKLLFLRRASSFLRKAKSDNLFNLEELRHKYPIQVVKQVMESPLDYHHKRITERLNLLSEYKDYPTDALKTAKEEELISVVVTCYNTSKYIYSALMSILQQSYRKIEVICVDDCSTDDTELHVHHLMRKDDRITWYSTGKNSGLSASRNLGLDHCHGNFVLFVDGDDCLLPGAIARLYNKMGVEDDVVAGSVVVHYEGGELLYGALVESDNKYYTNVQEKKINALTDIDEANNTHVSACGKLWRLSIIKENRITFPEGLFYEDACFFWKYLLTSPNLHIIKEPLYLYQRHIKGSIMSSTFEKKKGMAIQHVLILDDIYKFACEKNLIEQGKNVLGKLYEPFFWFAYNNSPEEDYDALFKNMSRIIKEQHANTSASSLLDYLSHYEDVSKGALFLKAFDGHKINSLETSPAIYRLNKKIKKYKKLTKLFVILSIVLLILLFFTIFLF